MKEIERYLYLVEHRSSRHAQPHIGMPKVRNSNGIMNTKMRHSWDRHSDCATTTTAMDEGGFHMKRRLPQAPTGSHMAAPGRDEAE